MPQLPVKLLLSVLLSILYVFLVGYFQMHAEAIRGNLLLTPLGEPMAVIAPRVPWEYYVLNVMATAMLGFVLRAVISDAGASSKPVLVGGAAAVLLVTVVAGGLFMVQGQAEESLLTHLLLLAAQSSAVHAALGILVLWLLTLVRTRAGAERSVLTAAEVD